MILVGNIVGIIGIIINFIIFQQVDKKKLIFVKLISDVVWAVHYGLIGAFSGMCVALICLPREIVFYNRGKKFADSIIWLFVFGAINILTAVITWQGMQSLLPATATIMAMIAFWQKNVKNTKYISLFVTLFMGTYDVFSLSYTGLINEIITFISIVISLYHLHRIKRD